MNTSCFFDNEFLHSADIVWQTGDYIAASDLLWRWWNIEILTPEQILEFAQVKEQTCDVDAAIYIAQIKKHCNELI